jgi:hypothetical protein
MEGYPMTTKTTRRAILAGVAAAIPALSLPALAAESDPIYAVIAEHEAAYHEDFKVCERQCILEESGGGETHINVYLSPDDIVETDDPQWKTLARDYFAAHRRYHDAQWALVGTPPTTVDGLRALFACLVKHQKRETERFGIPDMAWPDRRIGLTPEQDADDDMWTTTLLETLAKAVQS